MEAKISNTILKKAEFGNGLEEKEVIDLFNWLDDKEKIAKAKKIAEEVRFKIIGHKALFYTCLYISNKCENDCPYCGFRKSNAFLKRLTLNAKQVAEEAEAIKKIGIRNLILISGTIPEAEYKDLIIESVKILIEKKLNPWIEFENLSQDTLKELPKIGAKRFILFQETYDSSYKQIHSKSPYKEDPDKRIQTINQAVEAGFKEIGIGALFGLNKDLLIEILGLYRHAKSLMNKGVKVSISFPRLTPAPGLSINLPPHRPDYLEKAIIILRLAIPKVSLALSGREYPEFRDELFGVVDEIGSSGVPNPGGRTVFKDYYQRGDTQFSLFDKRKPKEIEKLLKKKKIIVDW